MLFKGCRQIFAYIAQFLVGPVYKNKLASLGEPSRRVGSSSCS